MYLEVHSCFSKQWLPVFGRHDIWNSIVKSLNHDTVAPRWLTVWIALLYVNAIWGWQRGLRAVPFKRLGGGGRNGRFLKGGGGWAGAEFWIIISHSFIYDFWQEVVEFLIILRSSPHHTFKWNGNNYFQLLMSWSIHCLLKIAMNICH